MTAAAPPNSRYTLSLLSSASSDSHPSLLVTFENQKYLFNTPEAISRVCVQNRIGIKKVGHVFNSDLDVASGGLPGFILSAVETGNKEIQVFGPKGLDHLVASYRFFTRREHLSLNITTIDAATRSEPLRHIHTDPNITVYSVPLTSNAPSSPTTLKRRRSNSSSPPRLNSPQPSSMIGNGDTSSATLSTSSASGLLFDPSPATFNPTRLKGAAAEQWRSLVISDMFRGRTFLDPSSSVPHASTIKVGQYKQSPAYLTLSLPPFDNSSRKTVLSYLVVGPCIRGKFLPEEAKKRGVPPGAAFSRLVAGERVWVPKQSFPTEIGVGTAKETKKERMKRMAEERARLANIVEGEGEGEWIESKDCVGPTQPGSSFLLLSIPAIDYLDSLLDYGTNRFVEAHADTKLRSIFYFLGPGVFADSRLTRFIESFPTELDISHRISSPDTLGNDPITFVASSLLTLRLSYLNRKIFKIPSYSFLPPNFQPSLPIQSPNVSLLRANDTFSQSPKALSTDQGRMEHRRFDFDVPSPEADLEASRLKGKEKSAEVQRAGTEAWETFLAKTGPVKLRIEKEELERSKDRQVEVGDDLRVTPLGTGSAIPSKYRNVSSTLIHMPGNDEGYILLDAGEGTWGQLARRFGDDAAESKEKVLRGIKMIFISHLHQDHHAGLATVLRQRAKLSPPVDTPLTIIGPPGARLYLAEQQELFELGIGSSSAPIHFVHSGALEPSRTLDDDDWRTPDLDSLKSSLNLSSIVTVPVLHRCRCWGIVITHRTGYKLVFSGDTMPCQAFAVAGQDATLLIHEATIEDGKEDLARMKGHSTFGQAIDMARKMRARHLLLTHFSARYPKLPPESTARSNENEEGAIEPIIATAFDLATMRLDDFWKFEKYRDAMDSLLSWDEAEESDDTGAVPTAMEVVDEEPINV